MPLRAWCYRSFLCLQVTPASEQLWITDCAFTAPSGTASGVDVTGASTFAQGVPHFHLPPALPELHLGQKPENLLRDKPNHTQQKP